MHNAICRFIYFPQWTLHILAAAETDVALLARVISY